jgi:hypothetical protein
VVGGTVYLAADAVSPALSSTPDKTTSVVVIGHNVPSLTAASILQRDGVKNVVLRLRDEATFVDAPVTLSRRAVDDLRYVDPSLSTSVLKDATCVREIELNFSTQPQHRVALSEDSDEQVFPPLVAISISKLMAKLTKFYSSVGGTSPIDVVRIVGIEEAGDGVDVRCEVAGGNVFTVRGEYCIDTRTPQPSAQQKTSTVFTAVVDAPSQKDSPLRSFWNSGWFAVQIGSLLRIHKQSSTEEGKLIADVMRSFPTLHDFSRTTETHGDTSTFARFQRSSRIIPLGRAAYSIHSVVDGSNTDFYLRDSLNAGTKLSCVSRGLISAGPAISSLANEMKAASSLSMSMATAANLSVMNSFLPQAFFEQQLAFLSEWTQLHPAVAALIDGTVSISRSKSSSLNATFMDGFFGRFLERYVHDYVHQAVSVGDRLDSRVTFDLGTRSLPVLFANNEHRPVLLLCCGSDQSRTSRDIADTRLEMHRLRVSLAERYKGKFDVQVVLPDSFPVASVDPSVDSLSLVDSEGDLHEAFHATHQPSAAFILPDGYVTFLSSPVTEAAVQSYLDSLLP